MQTIDWYALGKNKKTFDKTKPNKQNLRAVARTIANIRKKKQYIYIYIQNSKVWELSQIYSPLATSAALLPRVVFFRKCCMCFWFLRNFWYGVGHGSQVLLRLHLQGCVAHSRSFLPIRRFVSSKPCAQYDESIKHVAVFSLRLCLFGFAVCILNRFRSLPFRAEGGLHIHASLAIELGLAEFQTPKPRSCQHSLVPALLSASTA